MPCFSLVSTKRNKMAHPLFMLLVWTYLLGSWDYVHHPVKVNPLEHCASILNTGCRYTTVFTLITVQLVLLSILIYYLKIWQCFPNLLLADPFGPQTISTDPHILPHVNKVSGRYVSKIKILSQNITTHYMIGP